MKSLIIGMGEIGSSLYNVLKKEYQVDTFDIKKDIILYSGQADILHICFPYSDTFENQVKHYIREHKPKYTVVHSTVPPGTCDRLGVIHSPCIGIHPHLEKSLTTFTKFIGGIEASHVADYFRRAGMKVYIVDKAESTELMKILDTTFYALCIEYFKDIKTQCEKLDVPFELWTVYNENYNRGYEKLGYPEYVRPNLTPIMKKQGGHCTLPNCELIDTDFTRLIKKLND